MTALPTRKLEAWRYTDLRPLAGMSFATASQPRSVELPATDLPRLVFVNGRYDPARSAPPAFIRPFVTVAEGSTLALPNINAEHAEDGMTLAVPENTDAGVMVVLCYVDTDVPAAFHLRHRITLAAGAKLTLIEQAEGQPGVYWHDPVFDIALHENAALTHYRLQDESGESFHLATIRAKIAAGAAYESLTAMLGARLARAEHHVSLLGPGARAQLNAVQLLRGTQHGDFTTVITHGAPSCASRQTVKAVLTEQARGVFQGRIEVDRIAQKTDGYQMTQALLLSPMAEMDIKPELQIFADDVKCSHGATIGALDPEQIFYLRSRGIPDEQAKAMLVRAFLAEALEVVTQPEARTMFEAAIEGWWGRI